MCVWLYSLHISQGKSYETQLCACVQSASVHVYVIQRNHASVHLTSIVTSNHLDHLWPRSWPVIILHMSALRSRVSSLVTKIVTSNHLAHVSTKVTCVIIMTLLCTCDILLHIYAYTSMQKRKQDKIKQTYAHKRPSLHRSNEFDHRQRMTTVL